jgi:hypothetical protein
MKCCNNDCEQGRTCPERGAAWRDGDVAFTVVMLALTCALLLIAGVLT